MSSDREDGLPLYNPMVDLRPVMYINYNRTVSNMRSIHVATSGLESTCLVLACGLGKGRGGREGGRGERGGERGEEEEARLITKMSPLARLQVDLLYYPWDGRKCPD